VNKYIVCHFDIRFVPQVCSEWHSQDTIISTFALDCCLLQYSYKDTAHKKKNSPMSRSVSLLVTVATLGAMVRSSMAVTCYSCGPQEDDLARVLDNGTCSVAHHAEYCRDTAWCVKTWRGNTSDNMTGERWHQLMGWHLDCVWGEESHLQTDWASYCETRAFRFWDWTVTLARLILSLPMWTWHTQPVNGAIVDCRQTNIPVGQSVKT